MHTGFSKGHGLAVIAAALLAGAPSALAAPPKVGGLVPLTGPGGCLTAIATPGCTTDVRLGGAHHVAVSPNGDAIYVTADGPSSGTQGLVAAYARDPQTGRIGALLGCFSRTGEGPCSGEGGLYKADYIAVGPGGRGVYVSGSALVPLATDASTGALTGIIGDCFSEPLSTCDNVNTQQGSGIAGERGIAVAGNSVYLVGHDGPPSASAKGGLAAFARDPVTGALSSETNCLGSAASNAGGDPGCTNYTTGDVLLSHAQDIAAGPRQLYVVTDNDNPTTAGGVVSYTRDPTSGKVLARTECFGAVSSVLCNHAASLGGASSTPVAAAAAPDGSALYVVSDPTSTTSGVITAIQLKQDGTLQSDLGCLSQPALSGCSPTTSPSLAQPFGIAISPDSQDIYVASNGGFTHGFVTAYQRSAINLLPKPAPINCVSDAGAPGGCLTTAGIVGAEGIAISPDGRFVYVASESGGLLAFARELAPTCSNSSATTTAGNPIQIALSCSDPNGEALTGSVTSSPTHGSVTGAGPFTYTPNAGFTGTDAFTVAASDGTNGSGLATVTVTVSPSSGPPPPPLAGPTSRISGPRSHARIKASKLKTIGGTASAGAGIRSVSVGILKLAGGARAARRQPVCLYVTKQARLTRTRASKGGTCAATHLMLAAGTTRWSLALRHRLARGSYIVYSQAISRTGARETIRLRGGPNVARITVT